MKPRIMSDRELAQIRNRKGDPKLFHNLLLAQEDREKLVAHIDALENRGGTDAEKEADAVRDDDGQRG